MKFIKIELITIDYRNNINYIESNIKYNVHQKIYYKLINMFVFNENNVIEINNYYFDIMFHKRYNEIAISHVMIFKKKIQINCLIEIKSSLSFVTFNIYI